MDSDNYIEFERENDRLRESKSRITALLFVFILMTVISLGYIGLSEFHQPLFGKWPKMAEEYKFMQSQVDSLDRMKLSIDSLQDVNHLLTENSNHQDGAFFEVQIGAFEHFDLAKYKTDLAQIRGENVDQLDKYTLGKFRKYSMAKAFKQDIEKMGIKGAFIVGKIDGQRVEISEAVKASKKKIYK